jgi:epoxyqueuosine reductase
MNGAELSHWIKKRSEELGFSACGIAPAGFLEKDAVRLEAWLKEGMHGKMTYMEKHFEKRVDPRKLLDGAKSVIVFLYNYFPEKPLSEIDNFIISKYAYGQDYHHVIKDNFIP